MLVFSILQIPWLVLILSASTVWSLSDGSEYLLARRDQSAGGAITFSYPSPNVTRATFDYGPLNLVGRTLVTDLLDYLQSLQQVTPTTPKVVIFASANPKFFLGHLDIRTLEMPLDEAKLSFLADYTAVTRLFQNITSTAFVAEVNGHAFGAGHELALQMDLRFAGPRARVGSIEDAIGLTPGAGGELFLASRIGTGRAFEYVAGGRVFDGAAGAAIGLFNRFYDNGAALTAATETWARHAALFPRGALNGTKAALARLNPPVAALDVDLANFQELISRDETQTLVKKFLELSDNQTPGPFEYGLPTDSLFGLYGQWDGSV